jgi:hypothetical protein
MDPVDRAIEVLNRFLKADPISCKLFIERETPCNHAVRDDPDIQVRIKDSEDGFYCVRPLGVINGILGVIQHGPFKGWGPICVVQEESGFYSKFARTERQCKPPKA